MAHFKIGYHMGPGGNHTGIGDWANTLNAAGIPVFAKSVDHYGHLLDMIAAGEASQVENRLVFRLTTEGTNRDERDPETGEYSLDGDGNRIRMDFDVPHYDKPPAVAAQWHWYNTLINVPIEMDPEKVILELVNEIDAERADWVGWFSYYIGMMAINASWRVCLPAWNGGQPEPEAFTTNGQRAWLRLLADNKDRLSMSVHEYNWAALPFEEVYPDLWGRFEAIFAAADALHVARPNIDVTEFGFSRNYLPSRGVMEPLLEDAAQLYCQYPEVKGAALWALQAYQGNIHNDTQATISWVTDMALNFVPINPPVEPEPEPDCKGLPREPYTRVVNVIHSDATEEEAAAIFLEAWRDGRQTVTGSYDDAGIGDLENKTARLHGIPEGDQEMFSTWYATHYSGTRVVFAATEPTPPPGGGDYQGPAVTFVAGIDQPASDWRWETAKAVFDLARYQGTPFTPKFHVGGVNHDWYAAYKGDSFNVARILLDPAFAGGAQEIFDETESNIEKWCGLGMRDFVVLNEPNIEGMGVRWNNGTEFGEVFKALVALYRYRFPSARFWFPGCSPQFGGQHAFIEDARAAGAFDGIYGVCEHVYSGQTADAAGAATGMLAEVVDFQRRYALDKPLIVGEFSVNRPAPAAYKADVYNLFYQLLDGMPGIQAAFSFTSDWYNNPDANEEGWYEHNIYQEFL